MRNTLILLVVAFCMNFYTAQGQQALTYEYATALFFPKDKVFLLISPEGKKEYPLEYEEGYKWNKLVKGFIEEQEAFNYMLNALSPLGWEFYNIADAKESGQGGFYGHYIIFRRSRQ